MNTRRQFFGALAATVAASAADSKKQPVILVRNGWQWENIGDIAHTPGTLALVEKHVPEARLLLASTGLDGAAREMLQRRFPRLTIIPTLNPKTEPLAQAFKDADLLLHGSGPGVSAELLNSWQAATNKPSGIFGVTVSANEKTGKLDPKLQATLDKTDFVYTRETHSLANLQKNAVKAKHMAFAPDSTFAFDLQDEAKWREFAAANQLRGSKFIAVIPRLRYTPYHQFKKTTMSADQIKHRMEVNELHKEEDHAKLREVIIAWVRKTKGKVLLCPEMTYELGIIGPLLYDPLPADVKPSVVARKTYWMPDEAASTYRDAQAVVSCECHSPILAAANGTPFFYVRQPEDTIKGQMYADLGVADWAPRIEQTTGPALAEAVLAACARPEQSRKRAREVAQKAQSLQAKGMQSVRESLGLPRKEKS